MFTVLSVKESGYQNN